MIRLYIDSQYFHVVLVRNGVEQMFKRTFYWFSKYASTTDRTPHQMVGCLVDATSCMFESNHA